MSTRVLHVSDLHFGARQEPHDPAVESGFAELIGRVDPTVVLATGDLTHRGDREQHAQAARFLRSLGPPVVAVPGNHDIPLLPPARFVSPWRAFCHEWETTEPVYAVAGLHVVGLNSVRPLRHQSGGIRDDQLEAAATRLEAAEPGALRIVCMHHQLASAPWRTRKKPVARRSHVLARLVDSGAELIISGHTHQGAVAERHEFEFVAGELRGAVVATAPGFGRPRPHRRGEARGVLVYGADERSVRVETFVWRNDGFDRTAVRVFARGTGPLDA